MEIDYRHIFRTQPLRFILFLPNDPDFTIVDVSEEHCRLFGLERRKIVNLPLNMAFDDKSLPDGIKVDQVRRSLRRVIRTKQIQGLMPFHFTEKNRAGKIVERYLQPLYYPILNKGGEVIYIIQSSKDATDEAQAVSRAGSYKNQLVHTLSVGSIGLWSWDMQTNMVAGDKNLARILYCNEKDLRIGVPIQDTIDVVHKDDQAMVRQLITEFRNNTRDWVDTEFRVRLDGHPTRWVMVRAKTAKGKEDKTILPGVIVDITDRKKAELELRRLIRREHQLEAITRALKQQRAELFALNRTKDEFISLASHQLRTPATGVKQYLGLVLDGYSGKITKAQEHMLRIAYESNERQLGIVNDLLRVAQADAGKVVLQKSQVDFVALIQEVLSEEQAIFEEKQLNIHFVRPSDEVEIRVDRDRMRMVLENLINNAYKYTRSGKSITITLKNTKDAVRVTIADQGVGIRKKDIPRLFEKFLRIENPLSAQAGGTGLGLYWAQKIIALHDGEISVSSTLNKGSTFVITLPK